MLSRVMRSDSKPLPPTLRLEDVGQAERAPAHPAPLAVLRARGRGDAVADAGIRRAPGRARPRRDGDLRVPEPSARRHPGRVRGARLRGRPLEPVPDPARLGEGERGEDAADADAVLPLVHGAGDRDGADRGPRRRRRRDDAAALHGRRRPRARAAEPGAVRARRPRPLAVGGGQSDADRHGPDAPGGGVARADALPAGRRGRRRDAAVLRARGRDPQRRRRRRR